MAGGIHQETLDLSYVISPTYQQGLTVIFRELTFYVVLKSESPSFTVWDITTELFMFRLISCRTEVFTIYWSSSGSQCYSCLALWWSTTRFSNSSLITSTVRLADFDSNTKRMFSCFSITIATCRWVTTDKKPRSKCFFQLTSQYGEHDIQSLRLVATLHPDR